jgi:hypothetical protein
MARRQKDTSLPLLATTTTTTTTSKYKPSTIRHYKESSILKPVGPTTHSDDWPCFLLSDATVHRYDGSLANQLHADYEGPFIVRGKLELEVDNERYLINRHMKTKTLRIQIESSRAFSVGAKDDTLSVPVVWASGAAGWFEIVPAQSYQEYWEDMFHGVRLHYSLLDQYEAALDNLQNSKKKKKATLADVHLDLEELLFQYALRTGDSLTLKEAHQRFDSQAIFLLSHFPRDTNLYKELAEKKPALVQWLADKTAKQDRHLAERSKPTPLTAYDYSDTEYSASLEIVDGRKRGRGRPRSTVSRATRTSQISDTEVVDSSTNSHEARPSRAERAKRRSPTEGAVKDDDVVMIDPPNSNLASSSRPRDHQGVSNEDGSTLASNTTGGTQSSVRVLIGALEDVRNNLIELINQGKHKKQLNQVTAKSWQTKVYLECNIKHYNSVQEIFHYYARDLVHQLDPKWHDTQIYLWAKQNLSVPVTLTLISEAEAKQIVRRVKKSMRGAHAEPAANYSSRPEPTVYAGKQTPKNRRSGKAAGLRPSTGSKKRLRHHIDLDDEMDTDEDGPLRKKKSKSSHYPTEDEGNEDDDNDNDDVDEEEEEDSSDEAEPSAENGAVPITQVIIRAEKLPSTQPQGPNQTWICDEPDCGYIVRAAYEDYGRELISAHYEEHEREAQDMAQETALNRVNLAVQEATRGHMPINHLLEKIRNLGEKSKRHDEVILNGQTVPEPIKRTLFI